MYGRRGFGLFWGVRALLIAAVVGAVAYLAGLATASTAGASVGLGLFGFFWLLPTLFILLIVFGVLRGRRGWYGARGMYGRGFRGMYGRGFRGIPPTFDRWHQQAHAEPSGQAATPPAQPATPPEEDNPWQ